MLHVYVLDGGCAHDIVMKDIELINDTMMNEIMCIIKAHCSEDNLSDGVI